MSTVTVLLEPRFVSAKGLRFKNRSRALPFNKSASGSLTSAHWVIRWRADLMLSLVSRLLKTSASTATWRAKKLMKWSFRASGSVGPTLAGAAAAAEAQLRLRIASRRAIAQQTCPGPRPLASGS
eukprot:11227688-Lingulodinium_polyedra.AAC.1